MRTCSANVGADEFFSQFSELFERFTPFLSAFARRQRLVRKSIGLIR